MWLSVFNLHSDLQLAKLVTVLLWNGQKARGKLLQAWVTEGGEAEKGGEEEEGGEAEGGGEAEEGREAEEGGEAEGTDEMPAHQRISAFPL